MHLQRSEVDEARAALDDTLKLGACGGETVQLRRELARWCIEAAEGSVAASTSSLLRDALWILNRNPPFRVSSLLTMAESEWELRANSLVLVLALQLIETGDRFWRFDPQLRSLPPGLINAAISEPVRTEATDRLRSRRTTQDRQWPGTWTKHLLIERALGPEGHAAVLVELGMDWIDELRVRSSARASLPTDMQLGWWAIELALSP